MTATTSTSEELAAAQLKEVHRATWEAGDYAAVAEVIDAIPPQRVLDAAEIEPGDDVLDVATGTGNLALRAARAGARVIGLDLAPELFDAARRRAAAWGVDVQWLQGDAEDLPFADGRFDRVLSVFGVQFAPRHQRVAHELVRVTKPGGMLGLANWTPEGQVGRLFAILGRYLPPPPPFASPPPLWGDEKHVRQLFANVDPRIELEFERTTTPWDFPSAEQYVAFMETNYGPLVKARERLTGDGRWERCRAEIVALSEDVNVAADGTLHFDAEYLLAVARIPD